jgi:hypothetical protein
MKNLSSDLTEVSLSFLQTDTSHKIDRTNFIVTIESYFDSDNKVVFIDAPQGVGKSFLLSEFCKRNNKNTVSIFLNAADSNSYETNMVGFELSNQINCILENKELELNEFDATYLRRSHIGLKRLLKREYNKKLYFVFDGLDQIPDYNIGQIIDIISDLPISSQGVCFLFSGKETKLKPLLGQLKNFPSKEIPLTPFSLEETNAYLNTIDKHLITYSKEIYKITNGIGGKLDSIRKILSTGKTVEEIIDGIDDGGSFFSMEWSQINSEDELLIKLLAFLTYGDRKYPLNLLATLVNNNPILVQSKLNSLTFINIDNSSSALVGFNHDSYKKYAKTRLNRYESYVNESLIDYYLGDPDKYNSILNLSSIYEKIEKWDNIISLLTPSNMNILLERSQSLSTIIQQIEKGIEASKENKRSEDYFKYSLYKSTLLEFEKSDIWKSEIEAKIALKDYESAINLAQSAFLVEDRLKLLSIIAKIMKEKQLSIPSEIIDKIKEYYAQISFEKLKEDVVEIASNLMYSCPDLAINLVERTNVHSGGNMLDWALAQLSISSLKMSKGLEADDTFEEISSKIKNDKVKYFLKAINYFGRENNTADLFVLINSFNNPSEKLFLLRNWIRLNINSENIDLVIDEALKIIVKSSEYVPNASVMKDLAIGLQKVKNLDKLAELIDSIDTLRESIKQRGPTIKYISFNLLVALSELNISYDKAYNRVLETFYFIDDINDIATKTDALTIFVKYVYRLGEKDKRFMDDNFINEATIMLDKNITELLSKCAYHYEITKSIIINLTKTNNYFANKAFVIAKMLNTGWRRELAYCDLISNYFNRMVKDIDLDFIDMVLKEISHPENFKPILILIFDVLLTKKKQIITLIPQLQRYFSYVSKINDPIAKCYAYGRVYKILFLDKVSYSNQLNAIEENLYKSWDHIEAGWDRVEIAFKIASDLADTNLQLANQYLEIGIKERSKVFLDSPTRTKLLISTIKLAVRAFSGLVNITNRENDNYIKLKELISQIPSLKEKMLIWSDMALRMKKRKDDIYFKKIITEEILDNLNIIKTIDQYTKNELLCQLAPALFMNHQESTLDLIEKEIELNFQEEAIINILEYIFTKNPGDDKSEEKYLCSNISYEKIYDCIKLLEKLNTDAIIYSTIEKICDCLSKNVSKFTIEQKSILKGKMENIINSKLPDIKNIKHEGYKLISDAQLLRIGRNNYESWLNIFELSENLPNLSDKVVVIATTLEALSKSNSTRYEETKKSKIDETFNLIELIPTFNERIKRFTEVIPTIKEIDRPRCEEKIKSVFESTIGRTESSMLKAQKEMVDFAYKINPKIAESMVAKYDSDPARLKLGSHLQNHYNLLKMKSEIFKENNYEKVNLPEMCSLLVESLNSNKLVSKPLSDLEGFVKKISDSAYSDSFPISLFVVQNMVAKYQNTPSSDTILRRIFESTVFCCEMMGYLSRKTLNKTIKYIPLGNDINKINNIFERGDSEKAKKYIEEWAQLIYIQNIVIIDAYFGEGDLTLIKYFQSINPEINIKVLTGMKHNLKNIKTGTYEENYQDSWNNISIENPPQTEIIIVGQEGNYEPPFHDRWWVANDGETGLRVGTSFNSLGINKQSEISELSKMEATNIIKTTVEQYAIRKDREYKGCRLLYKIVIL